VQHDAEAMTIELQHMVGNTVVPEDECKAALSASLEAFLALQRRICPIPLLLQRRDYLQRVHAAAVSAADANHGELSVRQLRTTASRLSQNTTRTCIRRLRCSRASSTSTLSCSWRLATAKWHAISTCICGH
jgi:hypothetical protein